VLSSDSYAFSRAGSIITQGASGSFTESHNKTEERFVQMKSLYLIGLIALAVVSLRGQSSPVYWSTTQPDCSSLNNETPTTIYDSTGKTILGYSCSVSGTFVWLAAGGMWGTTIRVSAPASANVDADYTFYDKSGNNLSVDDTLNNDSTTLASGNETEVTLLANQPLEVEVLGATNDAGTNYSNTAEGTVYATFYCPDATTCGNVLPQLLYSALPADPWSLSVPIAWDDALSSQWSAVAIDDGGTNVVGLVIYNEDVTANTYTIDIYDSNGNLATSGTTPSIPPLQNGTGGTGEGGTYSVLLDSLVSGLPAGPFKILIDGGSLLSAVEVLQINGQSATTLQVAFDTAPGTAAALKSRRSAVRRSHVAPTHKVALRSLPK
jgi:hypothetical protein